MMLGIRVMIVRPGLLFFSSIPPSLALQTAHSLSYLLHALPSPLLYNIRAHQYLLMCTLRAPPTPPLPHCYLMYRHTVGAFGPPSYHV